MDDDEAVNGYLQWDGALRLRALGPLWPGWYNVERDDGLDPEARTFDQTVAAQLGASIEGPAADMLGLAAAIEARGVFAARRCAAHYDRARDRVLLWSPRNSAVLASVTPAAADALAAAIRRELGA